MLKFSDTVPDQIRFRLQSVNESNLDFVLKELYQFAECGVEGSVLLLQTCLAYLNHHRSDLNMHLEAVLVSVFKHIMTKPNFCTTFCLSLSSEMIKEDFLDDLSKALHLTVNEKMSIGLALSDSESMETRNCGKNFIMAQIEELLGSAASSRPVEQIQSILMFLHKSEDLSKHVDSFMQILSLVQLKNGGPAEFSASEEFTTEDIDKEANTYFQQMFSGPLTVEAMVQMLSRFKESSIKREQSIYDCIIKNLFGEYKFFPKYPERQLKISAVLFGCVINYQLVAHINLGIALRGVLDALREPADSKMFVFGTKALEQFVDRLTEWPQYCKHILRISHLRATHPEVVTLIERTLATRRRISSSHVESQPGTTCCSASCCNSDII